MLRKRPLRFDVLPNPLILVPVQIAERIVRQPDAFEIGRLGHGVLLLDELLVDRLTGGVHLVENDRQGRVAEPRQSMALHFPLRAKAKLT